MGMISWSFLLNIEYRTGNRRSIIFSVPPAAFSVRYAAAKDFGILKEMPSGIKNIFWRGQVPPFLLHMKGND
jgi:hypothetical protein